jgi:hypothetical protein
MKKETPILCERVADRTVAGIGPALSVGGLALLLATTILYPGGCRSAPEAPPRKVLAAEVLSRSAMLSPSLPVTPNRTAIEADPLEIPGSLGEMRATAVLTVRCRVVDELGHGVPDARIWADDGELRLRGLSDSDGAFDLLLDPDRVASRLEELLPVWIGARHRDHGPSILVPWRKPLEEELLLTLRGRGATLRLTILDSLGRPVEGVEATIGGLPGGRSPTGARVLGGSGTIRSLAPAPVGVSSSWGEILFEGLEPGRRALALHAYGYCPRFGAIELVDGEIAERRITIDYACSVRGRLTRDDGLPVEAGRVLGRGADPLSEVQVFCDENGEYLLERLPAGRVRLFAECRSDGRVTHTASAELTLTAGPENAWDARLTRQEEIHGRLVDSQANPLPGWRVELRLEEDPQQPLRTARTEADGRFSLAASPPGHIAQLYIFHPLSAGSIATRIVRRAQPGAVEERHQLAPGEEHSAPVRGTVRPPDGAPATGISFILHKLGGSQNYVVRVDEFDGSFVTPSVPSGEYVIHFPTHGRGWAADMRFRVKGGEPLDIGTIELQRTGTFELLPSEQKRRSESLQLRIQLKREGISAGFLYPIYAGRTDLPLELTLAPGRYQLVIPERSQGRPTDFRIESDQLTQLIAPGGDR